MSVPKAYRELGDFHKYYSGEIVAPVLTIVIGGNHEASNYFYELYHGGWLAPNIYYMGAASVIRYGPCRIAGISGIFKDTHFRKPHGERLPYSKDDIRSIYHVREYDVRKLLHITTQVDIGISHDWPTGVELFGDYKDLFAKKPHFLESAKQDGLGSKPAAQLMNHLRPKYWFSGHMHTRFTAIIEHTGDRLDESLKSLTLSESLKADLPILQSRPRTPPNTKRTPPKPPGVNNTIAEFLALGKVGQKREFMEVKEITLCSAPNDVPNLERDDNGKFALHYDEEWLAITRAFADGLMIKETTTNKINSGKPEKGLVAGIPKHKKWVKENVVNKNLLRIPENFVIHAPVYDPLEEAAPHQQPLEYPNSQTQQFYDLLQIPNPFQLLRDSS